LRILDNESDNKLDNVSLYLTKEEVLQLRKYVNKLLENPQLQHVHFSSKDYQKEITICLYDENELSNFDKRSKILIREDK